MVSRQLLRQTDGMTNYIKPVIYPKVKARYAYTQSGVWQWQLGGGGGLAPSESFGKSKQNLL